MRYKKINLAVFSHSVYTAISPGDPAHTHTHTHAVLSSPLLSTRTPLVARAARMGDNNTAELPLKPSPGGNEPVCLLLFIILLYTTHTHTDALGDVRVCTAQNVILLLAVRGIVEIGSDRSASRELDSTQIIHHRGGGEGGGRRYSVGIVVGGGDDVRGERREGVSPLSAASFYAGRQQSRLATTDGRSAYG